MIIIKETETGGEAFRRAEGVRPAPRGGDLSRAVTWVVPPGGATFVDVRELWRFRDLLYFLAWRDVKVRYKQTALGVAWSVLQPAMMMAVFTLFFRKMAGVPSGGVPYPLFAVAGLLPWTFFSTAVASAGNSVIGSERIITKVYFPRLAVPFAAVGAAVVDFGVALGLLGGMTAYYRVAPSANLWAAPLVFGSVLLAAAGLGVLFAALNVSYRDFRYVVPFLLQVGMFATPTVYMQAPPGRRPFRRARPGPGPQPDDRVDRRVPRLGPRRPDAVGESRRLLGVRGRPLRRRLPLLPQGRRPVRRRHLTAAGPPPPGPGILS